ncbi:MAG: histidine kinase [Leptothrix sp. (in: Bacteria)]|nr:histidine kinase [Leptothrix sp. (in: b-proteobacteria)]
MPLHIAETAPETPSTAGRAPAADRALLAEIAAGLVAENDLAALLQRFLDPIVRLAGAQAGAVRVLNDDGDRLEFLSALGLPAGACGSEQSVDRHCGHCGAAADSRTVVWAADLEVCARRSRTPFFGQDCQRLLAVPLQHRGRLLGVYNLFFAGSEEPGAEILAILRSVGDLLGLALNNARLEQENLSTRLASERQMMAAEVHDSLAQSLAFVKMRLPLLQDALSAHDEARARQYCEDLRCAVTQAHASLRSIITHLRSPMDPKGLLHALEAAADNFRRGTGASLVIHNRLPGLALTPEGESQVFHIVQEALTNIARHAAARHAWLHLAARDDGLVECVVEDDGAGLPAPAACAGAHYGMDIMRERARRIAGTLEVGPRVGGGTRVRLVFPAAGGAAPAPGGH